MRGHAAVREFLDAVGKAFPDLTFEMIEGPYVIPRSAALGGPLARAMYTGRLDPTTRSGQIDWVIVLRPLVSR
jgi:hypothetical protein